MESTLVAAATLISSLSGAWAVVRYKTEAHAESIKELRDAKTAIEQDAGLMRTEIAVLQSQAAGGDRRLTESLAAIERTISQSEQRVIAHVDSLVQAFSRGAK